MQFVANGPDIPNALLQAHEEGRVIFFCGAGISYPAGLPDFKELVEQVYKRTNTIRSEFEQASFDKMQFDTTLDLLERRLPGQRNPIRQAVAQALEPQLHREGAIDTHAALLRLARNREGALRLVTTNFDRVFHAAAEQIQQLFQSYSAPMLPVPKGSRWDGLVYLHGLLPQTPDATALNQLVLTSGDFGLAYLAERWAARFVSELFRNYVVCFVGYSINDPVLRYMMDALAADRRMGETTPKAWALGGCTAEKKEHEFAQWEAKGVTPILYNDSNNHMLLHKTLHRWAETYRDGVSGKKSIVLAHAHLPPSKSTQQDDFVGRMLWALSDKSGQPAKIFSEFSPTPVLEWLELFSDVRYSHGDLAYFGVQPQNVEDTKLRFSILRRPAPYTLAPPMSLASNGNSGTDFDSVMAQLARWLVRHLNDPRLILWVADQGGHLHENLIRLIEDALDSIVGLEREGNTEELDKIRRNSPNAIPDSEMRTLWRLLIGGHVVKSLPQDWPLYRWKNRLQRYGLTATLRLELRALLAPKIKLKKPFQWPEAALGTDSPSPPRKSVAWELVLASSNARSPLKGYNEKWNAHLPSLLNDMQQLLCDALDLLRELSDANELHDRSHWVMPSILPHWQNYDFYDWTLLIEMLRDSWLAVYKADLPCAIRVAKAWHEFPYPTFKRMALFAASYDNCIPPEQWVDWLLADGARWLWAVDTQREVCRLLALQGGNLTQSAQRRLETTVLSGPPRTMYREGISPDDLQYRIEASTWLRLIKLQESGINLSTIAVKRLTELSLEHRHLQLKPYQREEFSAWRSGTGAPDYEENKKVDIAPRKCRELAEWLKQPPRGDRFFHEDTWPDSCRKNMCNSLAALGLLAQKNIWPVERWQSALQVWQDKKLAICSWQHITPFIEAMPDTIMQNMAHSIAWWLNSVANAFELRREQNTLLLKLCRRVLSLSLEDAGDTSQDDDVVPDILSVAINHPIGLLTEAALHQWFSKELHDNKGLDPEIKVIFTISCMHRYGRVTLMQYLTTLFRVDFPWTKEYLLPLLDWTENQKEAKSAWTGFLYSPRLYPPMLLAIKSQFLLTARYYAELGEIAPQYAAFVTYAALGAMEGYMPEDFRQTIAILPQEGLEKVAATLVRALEGAGEQRGEYWENRVLPFWQHIWPKVRDRITPRIAESLAQLCIAADALFPAVLATVQDWLCPIEHPSYTVDLLHQAGLCSRFPRESLNLLDCILTNQPFISDILQPCLAAIRDANPSLSNEPNYIKLVEYIHG